MLINNATLSGIFKGFRVLFHEFSADKKTFWEQLATKVISSTGSETYAWLLNIPRMREWIGDRQIKNLAAEDYTIRNKEYESTVAIPRSAIEDDSIGVYRPVIGMMAETAKAYPDKLVADLLRQGDKRRCYDGLSFFSDAHKVGKAIVPNKGKKKLTPESYGAARAAMMSIKGEDGEPMGVTPNLLVVPPALEGMGRKLLLMQQVDGSDNIYYKSAELMVLPELAGEDTAWFLLDVSKPVKPFVVQERRPVEFTALDKPDDEAVFMKNTYLYGASWRGNAGYTLWQMAFKSDGTAA